MLIEAVLEERKQLKGPNPLGVTYNEFWQNLHMQLTKDREKLARINQHKIPGYQLNTKSIIRNGRTTKRSS
jgi:hypothetical protein